MTAVAMRRIRAHVPDGWRLVLAVTVSTALLIGFLGWRAYENVSAQNGLCEKIDRFIVASEVATRQSQLLTQAQKEERLAFYEDFRNDPPVCRTN